MTKPLTRDRNIELLRELPADATISDAIEKCKAFEIEFMTLDGQTAAVATIVASAGRPVTGRDISHSRHLQSS